MTESDKNRYGYTTGLYEICTYGYGDNSFSMLIAEDIPGSRYDANDARMMTLNIESKSYAYFRYTNDALAQKCTLNL